MSLHLDAAWAAGLLLAMTRVAAFVVASPLLPRAVPVVARAGVVVVLGAFLATPLDAGATDVGALLAAGVVNAVVGVALGYLTGVIFHLFPIAGNVIDASSGLSVAALIDPSIGEHGAVFGRLFSFTALTVFLIAGGLESVVRGLAASVEAIPLDGAVSPAPGLVTLAVRLVGRLVLAGVELALPAAVALFAAEVALGLASRFAPQMNVFLLGLPLKLLAALGVTSAVVLLFPEAVAGMLDVVRQGFVDGLNGLGT